MISDERAREIREGLERHGSPNIGVIQEFLDSREAVIAKIEEMEVEARKNRKHCERNPNVGCDWHRGYEDGIGDTFTFIRNPKEKGKPNA